MKKEAESKAKSASVTRRRTTFDADSDLMDKVDELSRRQDTSVSAVVRKALRNYLTLNAKVLR